MKKDYAIKDHDYEYIFLIFSPIKTSHGLVVRAHRSQNMINICVGSNPMCSNFFKCRKKEKQIVQQKEIKTFYLILMINIVIIKSVIKSHFYVGLASFLFFCQPYYLLTFQSLLYLLVETNRQLKIFKS